MKQAATPAPTGISSASIDHSMHAHTGAGASEHDEHGLTFWIGLIIGLFIAGFGVRGMLHQFKFAQQRYVFVRYLVVSDLTHDLIWAPIAFVAAFVTSRVFPKWLRPPIAFGAFASTVSVALAWYPLHGTAKYKQNPSFQPLNYATAVATVLVVIWGIALLWAIVRFRSRTNPAK